MDRRPLHIPLTRRPLNVPPAALTRRPLVLPTAPVQAPLGPALAPRARHPFAGPPPLAIEDWPEVVYGFHPTQTALDGGGCVIAVKRGQSGYYEVSSEIDPFARNRSNGVTQDIAEAVIRAAWAPDGPVWHHKGGTF
jgi:hypothetical protein